MRISLQSFAGLHIHGKRLAIFIDEPSTVADVIFEVIEGALADKDTEVEHLNLLALPVGGARVRSVLECVAYRSTCRSQACLALFDFGVVPEVETGARPMHLKIGRVATVSHRGRWLETEAPQCLPCPRMAFRRTPSATETGAGGVFPARLARCSPGSSPVLLSALRVLRALS